MKTRTRLSALLLALCLIVSMMVPAVSAVPENAIASVTADGYTTYYSSVAETVAAINAATAETVVTLLADVDAIELDIAVAAGVTLNMNGCNLTVKSFTSFKESVIMDDNAEKRGVLKASSLSFSAFAANGNNLAQTGQEYYPLYDDAQGGLSFFLVTITNLGISDRTIDENQMESAKFWFRLNFDHNKAYELIATQKSKLTMRPYISYKMNGTSKTLQAYLEPTGNADDFFVRWANAVAENPDIAISLTVKNLQLADSGSFALKPRISIKADGTNNIQLATKKSITLPAAE